MIATEATRAASPSQDLSAERTRDLSAPLDRLAAEPGQIRSGALLGLVAGAWDAGYAAARSLPVCDWCDQPVVKAKLSWCHRTGFYGCEAPVGRHAQVDGSSLSARHAA